MCEKPGPDDNNTDNNSDSDTVPRAIVRETRESTMVDAILYDYTEVLQHISSAISEDNLSSATVDGVPIRKLFVSNLAERTTFKDLKNCFSMYGNVESCYLSRNQGRSNYAFVTFSTVEDASRAMKHGSRKQISLHNRDLRVMPADSWHQPDSMEQQLYYKRSKICNEENTDEQHTQGYLQNDSEKVSIHILNNDCLRHILELLPISDRIRAERVCKRWQAVSLESWRTMKALDFTSSKWGSVNMDRVYASTLRKLLLRCGRFLTRLDLSDSRHCLTQNILNIAGRLCPNLTDVDLNGLVTRGAGISALARNCKNITKFTIGLSSHNLDNDLRNLFNIHKNLEYLEINNNMFSGKCLTFLSAETMRTLILYRCTCIHDFHLSAALERLGGLEKLVISECTAVNERTLENISQYCINLKVLYLQGLFHLMSKTNPVTFTNLVKLENIRIAYNDRISDDVITNMALNCRELVDVDITGCDNVTDTGLASIATLPKLERLIINYIKGITDHGLRDIRGLKVFECRTCTITNEGLLVILTLSPRLRLLDISGCINVNKRILEVAKEVCNRRDSNVLLKMIVGGTSIYSASTTANDKCSSDVKMSPFLQTVNIDLCNQDIRYGPAFYHRYTIIDEVDL